MAKKTRRTARKTSQANGISSYIIPIIVGVVMVVLVVGAIVLNEKRISSAAAVRPEDISVPVVTVEPQPTQSIPYPDVPRVTLKETQSLLEKGQAVLIDIQANHCTTLQFKSQVTDEGNEPRVFSVQNLRKEGQ